MNSKCGGGHSFVGPWVMTKHLLSIQPSTSKEYGTSPRQRVLCIPKTFAMAETLPESALDPRAWARLLASTTVTVRSLAECAAHLITQPVDGQWHNQDSNRSSFGCPLCRLHICHQCEEVVVTLRRIGLVANGAKDATIAMQQQMTPYTVRLQQSRCHLAWSHLASTALMGNAWMALQWSPGETESWWSGMQPVLTHLPTPTL